MIEIEQRVSMLESQMALLTGRSPPLRSVVATGTGEELDKLGKLIDLPRRAFAPERQESDEPYRQRIMEHPLVQLLLGYL